MKPILLFFCFFKEKKSGKGCVYQKLFLIYFQRIIMVFEIKFSYVAKN